MSELPTDKNLLKVMEFVLEDEDVFFDSMTSTSNMQPDSFKLLKKNGKECISIRHGYTSFDTAKRILEKKFPVVVTKDETAEDITSIVCPK